MLYFSTERTYNIKKGMKKDVNILETVDKNRMVAFKNELLASPFRKSPELMLSTPQAKLILLLVSLIDMDDTEFKEYEITFKQFCEHFGISYEGGKSRKLIREQLRALMNKELIILEENGTVEAHYHWLGRSKIYLNEHKIKVKLSEDLRPYYLGLKRSFTQYQLGYVAEFKNRYSFLLYDILHRWMPYKQGEFYYPIEEAKADLCFGRYEDTRDFTRYVLKPAIEEINKKSDLFVVWNYAKSGRKITSICFTIKTKKEDVLEEMKAAWSKKTDVYASEKKAFEDNQEQLYLEGFCEYEEEDV